MNLWRQDKGQKNCVQRFMQSIQSGGKCPIPDDEIFEVARVTLDIDKKLRNIIGTNEKVLSFKP